MNIFKRIKKWKRHELLFFFYICVTRYLIFLVIIFMLQ